MTADHARAIADYFAEMFDREGANTVKVLRAVPDDRRDYKPDEKSRTAWELATHIAGSDMWFLDSVCDGVFVYDPEVENKRTAGLDTINDVVAFYEREFPRRIERLRATPGERLAKAPQQILDGEGERKHVTAPCELLAHRLHEEAEGGARTEREHGDQTAADDDDKRRPPACA